MDWSITIFSLSSLPNTLIMGLPLLVAMYGPYSGDLMVQVVVLQSIVWYTLLLVLSARRTPPPPSPPSTCTRTSSRSRSVRRRPWQRWHPTAGCASS
jgi:hypothetical protein